MAEKDLKSFLQGHSVFSKFADVADGDKSESLRNLVAYISSDELLAFNPKTNSLFVIALNSWSKSRSEQVQELTFDSIPPVGIKQVICHKNGKLVCLLGSSRCAIIDIGEKKNNFYAGSSPLQCRIQHVGAYLHTAKPSTRVLQVEWHPLSDSHFGVLTSDNALRLYDISNVDECEQTFHLYSLTTGSHSQQQNQQTPNTPYTPYTPNTPYTPQSTPSRSLSYDPQSPIGLRGSSSHITSSPFRDSGASLSSSQSSPDAVSFSFGAGYGWTSLSVFFLSRQGNVHCICPVLPNHVRLPKSLVLYLRQSTLAKIQVLKEMGSDEVLPHYGYYNAHLKWLSDIIEEDDLADEISNISISNSNENINNYNNINGFVQTRPPSSKLNLVVQGPMDAEYPGEPPENRIKPCNLLYLSYERKLTTSTKFNNNNATSASPPFGVVIKLFAGGLVEVLLNLEDTNPLWTVKNQTDFETFVPQLILYEQAKLEVSNNNNNNNNNDNQSAPVNTTKPTPYILQSPFYPFHFMIMDSTGLFSLQLTWLEKFREYVDTTDHFSELPTFPQSQLSLLVTGVTPKRNAPLLGVTLLNPGFNSGYFVFTLFPGFRCTCIEIQIENSEALPMKVVNGVTKPLRKQPIPFSYLSASSSPLNSMEVWAMLTSAVAHFRKEYFGYIQACEKDADENFAALNEELDAQTKSLQYERQRIAEQTQQSIRIEKRLAGAIKVQDHAAKRIKNIIAITNSSKTLSKAERDYFKELYDYYYLVHTKLKSRLEELSYQTERELRKMKFDVIPEVSVPLNEDELLQISNTLQNQYATISQTAQSVKDLEIAISQHDI